MSQHSDQAAAASPPAAPAEDGDGATLTAGGILTVAGILVLFVVLAFGLSSVQFCLNYFDNRLRGAQRAASPSERRRRRSRAVGNGTRGVDPDLLRSLPVTVYRAAAAAAKDDDDDAAVECAVCLAELEDGEQARFLPRCGHGFHAECVDAWLAAHTTCPLCRLTVAKQPHDDVQVRPQPAPAALAPVPRELANYASNNLPASVLLGASDHRDAVGASTDRGTTTMQLVIEIPGTAAPTAQDAAKSPGSARLRTIRRLWSFGRQQGGAGSTSSTCSCAGGGGGGEGADVAQGFGVTIGIAVTEPQLPSEAAAAATRGAAA